MTEWKPGQRVVVNGKFDGEEFVNEAGEIVEAPPYMERHFLVRFDSIRDVFHNGRGSREADENRHWYFTKGHEGYTFTPEAHSTYLNGHADAIKSPDRKFAAGDRVRLIADYGTARRGATATVAEVPYTDGDYLHVRWDRDTDLAGGLMDGGYSEYRFERVDTSGKSLPLGTSPSTKETTSMFYLTAWKTGLNFVLTGDNPFPSQREADNHANELAATHGDTTVVVLKVTSQHSSRVVVTTEHAA